MSSLLGPILFELALLFKGQFNEVEIPIDFLLVFEEFRGLF